MRLTKIEIPRPTGARPMSLSLWFTCHSVSSFGTREESHYLLMIAEIPPDPKYRENDNSRLRENIDGD
jgi:hypothetical protein